jgi:hypothetical protein
MFGGFTGKSSNLTEPETDDEPDEKVKKNVKPQSSLFDF